MKTKHIGLLIFLGVGLLSGGCKKELNVFPTTAEVDGNLITDQQTAEVVLNGVYSRFANSGEDIYGIPATLWSVVNETFPSELAGSVGFAFGYNAVDMVDLTPDNGFSTVIWNYGYALVNAANGFIKNVTPVGNIPAAAKQQMIAEAKFLKAFGNSELLLYYGQYNDPSSKYGIILRDTFVTSTNINLPRSGVADAYSSILSDLDSAIQRLPLLNTAIFYANASSAKLLKARVLMNRGARGDYTQVINLTNDVISNGPFVLEDSVKDIFLTKGFASKEVMLGIQPYPDQNYKYSQNQIRTLYIATKSLVNLLEEDSRDRWVYKYAYTNPGSYLHSFANQLTKYYTGDLTNIAQTPLSEYSYAFRLSEVYLLEAEAITLSGGDLTSAKSLLTTVMSHAGAGPQELAAVANASTPETLQLEITKENMRNFAYENGADWFALRRLPFATMQQLNPNIKDSTKLILPIPTSELTYNNVIQNPGY